MYYVASIEPGNNQAAPTLEDAIVGVVARRETRRGAVSVLVSDTGFVVPDSDWKWIVPTLDRAAIAEAIRAERATKNRRGVKLPVMHDGPLPDYKLPTETPETLPNDTELLAALLHHVHTVSTLIENVIEQQEEGATMVEIFPGDDELVTVPEALATLNGILIRRSLQVRTLRVARVGGVDPVLAATLEDLEDEE